MNIKNYLEELLTLQEEVDAVILEIYITGSQPFKDNPKDLDYIVVCSGYTQRYGRNSVKEDGVTYDFFILDTEAISAQQDFTDDYYIKPATKMYAYTTQVHESIYGDHVQDWDMMEHEVAYKQFLKKRYGEAIN